MLLVNTIDDHYGELEAHITEHVSFCNGYIEFRAIDRQDGGTYYCSYPFKYVISISAIPAGTLDF